MSHTNVAFNHDSSTISLGDLSSNGQYKLSPADLQRINDQPSVAEDLNVDNSSHALNDAKQKNDVSLEQKVPDVEIKPDNSNDDDNSYYSLKHLREGRHGKRDEDSSLSRRVKRFYKDQDELIDMYEHVHNQGQGNEEDNAEEKQKYQNTQRMSNILTKVSLVANIVRIIHFLINQIPIISYSSVYLY
jgi:hypothetical protein